LKFTPVLVGLIAVTSVVRADTLSRCDAVFHLAVRDQREAGVEQARYRQAQAWLCQQHFDGAADAQARGASISIPDAFFTMTISGLTTSTWVPWLHAMCTTNPTATVTSTADQRTWRAASEAVIQAWIDCTSAPGVHVWFDVFGDSRRFVLRVAGSTGSTSQVTIDPLPNGPTCENLSPNEATVMTTPLSVECVRQSDNAVTATVHVTPDQAIVATLPAAERPVPTPPVCLDALAAPSEHLAQARASRDYVDCLMTRSKELAASCPKSPPASPQTFMACAGYAGGLKSLGLATAAYFDFKDLCARSEHPDTCPQLLANAARNMDLATQRLGAATIHVF
jgi:hypothetical protein